MNESTQRRRARMGALACASPRDLAERWTALGLNPDVSPLRGPEAGLIMLRGRIGGGGAPFNVGEATVTRASVKLADGTVGHAFVLGRDSAHCRIAAIVDALCADPALERRIETELIAPLKAAADAEDARLGVETAATRVDFFTMVRGED